jgi:hypothetical protein
MLNKPGKNKSKATKSSVVNEQKSEDVLQAVVCFRAGLAMNPQS